MVVVVEKEEKKEGGVWSSVSKLGAAGREI